MAARIKAYADKKATEAAAEAEMAKFEATEANNNYLQD
jgi:hypothetical protein